MNLIQVYDNDIGTLMYTVGEEEMCEVLEKCIMENKRFQIFYQNSVIHFHELI